MLKKWNVTKTDMSTRQKCHQNWIVTKTEMSETEMSPKLKCYENWNVTKTEMLTNIIMSSKSKSKSKRSALITLVLFVHY